MTSREEIYRLEDLACEMRVKLLELCGSYAGSVHIGGDLSMTDMLIALYHHAMNVDPKDIKLPTRDRFVLSKGHGAIAMYAAMAMRGLSAGAKAMNQEWSRCCSASAPAL